MTIATPPLTVFAIPRAFHRNIGIGQRNAIRSWDALRPRPRILLMGDDPGTAEMAREIGARHFPNIDRNEFGTPLLGSLFALAHEEVSEGYMMFLNSDIIMTSDLMPALGQIASPRNAPPGDKLMVGRRTCMYVRTPIDFADAGWENQLRRQADSSGTLWGPTAIDYFVFPRHLFRTVPPFAVGRGWWDHWLLAEAERQGVTIVDASASILAVHQNHDFLATEESIRNLALFRMPMDSISLDRSPYVLKHGRVLRRSRAAALQSWLLRAISTLALRASRRLIKS